MKKNIICLLLIILCFSCKDYKEKKGENNISTEKTTLVTILDNVRKSIIKDTLTGVFDFKKTLNTIKNIKHTKDKHQDWMSNKASTLKPSLQLGFKDFKVKTTSYTYKKDCIFYLHTLSHTNDSISIKPFLENVQGKRTEGYTLNRVLIFAMKNDKDANFIDIPEKLNPLKLREELLDSLYKKIDSDIILCNRTKKCEYKDLRK